MDIVRKEPQRGWIEVVTGSMFSGKSEELIRRLRRAQIARQKVQIFKPFVDDRYDDGHIVSHSDMRLPSTNVRNSDELLRLVDDDTELVASSDRVLVGATGVYEARCRHCFDPTLAAVEKV